MTVPIEKPIPGGAKVAYIENGPPSGKITGNTLTEAAAVPGLTATVGGQNFSTAWVRGAGKLIAAMVPAGSKIGEVVQAFIPDAPLQAATKRGIEE